MNNQIEEGDTCPECHKGNMGFEISNCSCHISAPCHACVEAPLVCTSCGHMVEVEPYIYRHVGGGITEMIPRRPSSIDLGDGKRIFDYDYNSASGSTMVWEGKYEGDVTAQDILNHFGDGTFGHRGPYLANGQFTYTQITD